MDTNVQSASLGPVFFFGLCALALMMQGEPDIDSNPKLLTDEDVFVAPSDQVIDLGDTTFSMFTVVLRSRGAPNHPSGAKLLEQTADVAPAIIPSVFPYPAVFTQVQDLQAPPPAGHLPVIATTAPAPALSHTAPVTLTNSLGAAWQMPHSVKDVRLILGEYVRLRDEPGYDANVLAYYSYGTFVQVMGQSGPWVWVTIDTATGWMHQSYLSQN
ncbi:MAG: SH3 domain-containing protein [Pseudomonadota bacterium]